MSIVLAAAGTGGHVYPALAVAGALVERGVPAGDLVFFGGNRMESAAVPAAGYPFVEFRLPRLRRSAALSNLAIPGALWRTARAMEGELRRRDARAVLGTSGYATVPAVLAARRAGIPFVLQEQNAAPGLAARFAARRAVATFLGLPGPAQRLPRSRLAGNPLRPMFSGFDRAARQEEGRRRYGLGRDALVLGVLGGSLGARVLNQAVPGIVEAWEGEGLEVVHLTGRDAYDEVTQRAGGSPLPWRCIPFEDRMDLFYAAADLVLCRAGAMTISELAATATPAVVVPLEAVGQQANAAALERAGGAVVVPQSEAARLAVVVTGLASDRSRIGQMSDAAGRTARPEAAGVVADALLEAADG